MRYIELIMNNPLVWGLFLAYMAFTSYLAWMGHKKTTDIESFAVGSGDMNPIIVGVTLAASIASTATFVINPGFVYVHGLSAFMHFGVAAGAGVILGLVIMSLGFRRFGKKTSALTLPQWVGERYQSRLMTVFFAFVNLLSITFVVLIVGSLSIVMQKTLGLSNTESLILVIGFVFSYIFVGGTYAHAYTNTLQGMIMVVVAAIIVGSGIYLFGDGIGAAFDKIATVSPALVEHTNPTPMAKQFPLWSSWFSVYFCGFIIGFAVVVQPHILIKALYVEEDKHVWQYLGVCIFVSLFFSALLLVGFYAHLKGMSPEQFIDPVQNKFRQDLVMTEYIKVTFGPFLTAFIMVALMSAGMSTLDGLLLALSSIAANDLFLNLTRDNVLKDKTPKEQALAAHRASQIILIVMGIITFLIALSPPKLLGIFGQLGVYAIVAASVAPILCGILFPRMGKWAAFAAAIAGITLHFIFYGWGQWALSNKVVLNKVVAEWGPLAYLFDTQSFQLGFLNPGVTATYGIVASLLIGLGAGLYSQFGPNSSSNDDASAPLPEGS